MIWMWSLAALLGGLFVGLRDVLQLLAARGSGVIARKGLRDVRVRRDIDPDGFARLLANRGRGATIGIGVSAMGVVGLSLAWLSLVGVRGPLAVVVGVAYLGCALFAGYCLVRGFATGHMFAVWSLTLFGEATRKQNATWFWVYAAINLVVVFGVLSTAFGALAG